MTAEPVPIRAEPTRDEDYLATVPGLPPGVWSGSLRSVEPATWTDDETHETKPTYRWTWDVDLDGRLVEFVKVTGRRLTRNSAFLETAVALAGPEAITPATQIDVRSLVAGEATLTCSADPDHGYRVTVSGIPKRGRRAAG
jgi:hypothetical protein